MKIELDSLETYNRLAKSGAESAAQKLNALANIDVGVSVTKVDFVPSSELGRELSDNQTYRGVEIDLKKGLEGKNVLLFDQKGAEEVIESLKAMESDGEEFGPMEKSAIQEIGNIMTSGFIDGWADHLQTTIDHTPPSYLEGGKNLLKEKITTKFDFLIAFIIELEVIDEKIDFLYYMLPRPGSFEEQMSSDDGIEAENFVKLNKITQESAKKISSDLTTMTGICTEIEITRLNFIPIEDVSNQIMEKKCVSVVTEFSGKLHGYLLAIFDLDSAERIVCSLMGDCDDEEEFGPMEKSAIQEIGNIMTSGFIDGWADHLQTTIDHTPPRLVEDIGKSIAESISVRLAQEQDFVFIFDTSIIADEEEFNSDLYVFFRKEDIVKALGEAR